MLGCGFVPAGSWVAKTGNLDGIRKATSLLQNTTMKLRRNTNCRGVTAASYSHTHSHTHLNAGRRHRRVLVLQQKSLLLDRFTPLLREQMHYVHMVAIRVDIMRVNGGGWPHKLPRIAYIASAFPFRSASPRISVHCPQHACPRCYP